MEQIPEFIAVLFQAKNTHGNALHSNALGNHSDTLPSDALHSKNLHTSDIPDFPLPIEKAMNADIFDPTSFADSLSTENLADYSEDPYQIDPDGARSLNWGVLGLSVIILATILGNMLVCLAVCWESRLQNMTNYFLMSLAIADLLVAVLVMPVGMVIELYGEFPLGPSMCVLYIAADVLMCTASIWHMCTMSMDRYFTLKYPMKYGRNKTKTMVITKITFVWVVSLAICSPIVVMGYANYDNVFTDGVCAPQTSAFVIYGSILAFYVPLMIMVVTYVLTTRILRNNQRLMARISQQHRLQQQARREANAGITPSLYKNMPFLSPNASSYMYFYQQQPQGQHGREISYDSSDVENMICDGYTDIQLDTFEYEEDCVELEQEFKEYYLNNKDTHNRVYTDQRCGLDRRNSDRLSRSGSPIANERLSRKSSSKKQQCLTIFSAKSGKGKSDSRRSSILSNFSVSQPNLAKKGSQRGSYYNNITTNEPSISRSQSFRQQDFKANNKWFSGRLRKKDSSKLHQSPSGSFYGNSLLLPKQSRRNSRSQPDLTAADKQYLSTMYISSSQNSLALPPLHGCSSRPRLASQSYHGTREWNKASGKHQREVSSVHRHSNHHIATCDIINGYPNHRHFHTTASNPHLAQQFSSNTSLAGVGSEPRYASIKSVNSVLELESVQNFDSLSNASSVHSLMSRRSGRGGENGAEREGSVPPSDVWEDFERPVMLRKLTRIEAEMDQCLSENASTTEEGKQRPKSDHTEIPASDQSASATVQIQVNTTNVNHNQATNRPAIESSNQNSSQAVECCASGPQTHPFLSNGVQVVCNSSYDIVAKIADKKKHGEKHSHYSQVPLDITDSKHYQLDDNDSVVKNSNCPRVDSTKIKRNSVKLNADCKTMDKSDMSRHNLLNQKSYTKPVFTLNNTNQYSKSMEPLTIHIAEDTSTEEVSRLSTGPLNTHVIPPVCISSPSPINSRSSQCSDLERDGSLKSQSTRSGGRLSPLSHLSPSLAAISASETIPYPDKHPDTAQNHGTNQNQNAELETQIRVPIPTKICHDVMLDDTAKSEQVQKSYTEAVLQQQCSISSDSSAEMAETPIHKDKPTTLDANKLTPNRHDKRKSDDGHSDTNCSQLTVSTPSMRANDISSTLQQYRNNRSQSVTPQRHCNPFQKSQIANGGPKQGQHSNNTTEHNQVLQMFSKKKHQSSNVPVFKSNKKVQRKKKKGLISKKTATNERKASKVLGIIFAVFVILWTPFFFTNILISVCASCNTGLTPTLFTTLTWLGYLSSLMNPIIYTMFNTSFRTAFQKILTCQYKFCCCCCECGCKDFKQKWKPAQSTIVTSYNRCPSSNGNGKCPPGTTFRRTNSLMVAP